MSETTSPRLGPKFQEALGFAAELHRTQTRKASQVPYVGHLLSVAGLVIEADGTETEAIAALLHDAAEDQGGDVTLTQIEERFGPEVAAIVEECSDTVLTPKPPWRERKQAYIEHLNTASDSTIRVSVADKLDNARAILRDLRRFGPKVWQRFNTDDPHEHLWYYRSLLEVYRRRSDSWLVDELSRVVETLAEEIGPPVAATV
ncbi:phosphohydrolase [Mycolicibacterium acapulense]|uniref:HD domain-containing protein n=1 Tax=Mycolicibacterium novocastrense TaxID=59813 RepID=A0AAW5SUS2_MYCNV|nr:HD domain-containing protein [Mycolicibacterium novocastrense]KUH94717.1 phosphohydrolase [Mycolicibacterium acapulense]MCV7027514.1 HD domain-containing protein [Mycolicibacterium novocastrense]GAT10493.1 metal dependent phosphohydrolase [Mycolicibacterium novocastrense]